MKVFSGSISSGNSIIANDDASNTPYDDGDGQSIDNTDNGGYGYDGWAVSVNGTAGTYVGPSTSQGFGDINVNGEAWGGYAISSAGGYLGRDLPRALSVGFALSATIATSYRTGGKGFNIFGGANKTDFIVNFNASNDNYQFNGSNLPSGGGEIGNYSQTAIWDIVAKQTGTSTVQVTLTRRDLSLSTSATFTDTSVRGFEFYIENAPNTDGGNPDSQNIRFNSLKVYRY